MRKATHDDSTVKAALSELEGLRASGQCPEPAWFHPFPARMPISVAEHLISRITMPAAVVLDPMVGSGTSLIAARKLGRHSVGFERDPLALLIARSAIADFNSRRLEGLVTGSGMPELLETSLVLMKRLVLDHKRFVFIPSSTTARELLTIGNALQPLEYAIVDSNEDFLVRIAEGHYRGEAWGTLKPAVDRFVEECGRKVVAGMYRVSKMSPPQMFYAHVEHSHEAVLIAMADSALQEHRGFPMLIDLADGICRASFGATTFAVSMQLAYAQAGEPFRYLSERRTRR